MKTTPLRVEKPWGYELIWAHTDDYVGKILHVEAGEALSLQYHERKDETLYLLSGRLRLEVGFEADALEETVMEPGDGLHLAPGTIHRMTALETSDLLEASTSDLDDVIRLQDRYGRVEPGS